MNRNNRNNNSTGYGSVYIDLSMVGAEVAARQAEQRQADRARMDEAAAVLRKEREAVEAAEKAQRAAQQAALQERRTAQQEQAETRLKVEARSHYVGTDASFETDWPTIRANIMAERVAWQSARDRADMRERTREDF